VKLTIVTAMYKSQDFVRRFYEEVSKVASTITDDFEIIFVDDRSPDDSAKIVEEIIAKDKRVRLIQLSRNFGQSAAMLAGMRKARGDYVYTSDVDLEDPPELMAQFYEKMRTDDRLESVYGFMAERKGTFLERWLGRIFYVFLDFFSRERIPHQVWARLMTRKFLDALLMFSEYHLFWSGLFHTVGFKQLGVPVDRKKTGKTSYNYRKKIELALTAVTSFSSGPLHFIFLLGLFVSGLSFLGALIVLFLYLRGDLVPGWVSIVLSILFTGGVTNLSIGLIGVYVGRIFVQSKQRPHFFIDREL
jgi:putative glycosyltransferase